jgi:hypothetical protein
VDRGRRLHYAMLTAAAAALGLPLLRTDFSSVPSLAFEFLTSPSNPEALSPLVAIVPICSRHDHRKAVVGDLSVDMTHSSEFGYLCRGSRRASGNCTSTMSEDDTWNTGLGTPVQLCRDRSMTDGDAACALATHDRASDRGAISDVEPDAVQCVGPVSNAQNIWRVEHADAAGGDAIARGRRDHRVIEWKHLESYTADCGWNPWPEMMSLADRPSSNRLPYQSRRVNGIGYTSPQAVDVIRMCMRHNDGVGFDPMNCAQPVRSTINHDACASI